MIHATSMVGLGTQLAWSRGIVGQSSKTFRNSPAAPLNRAASSTCQVADLSQRLPQAIRAAGGLCLSAREPHQALDDDIRGHSAHPDIVIAICHPVDLVRLPQEISQGFGIGGIP
jgi:hypothetical protein